LFRRLALEFTLSFPVDCRSNEVIGTFPEKDSNVFEIDEGVIMFTVTVADADAWPFTRKLKAKSNRMV
jgi:hypothetical protein